MRVHIWNDPWIPRTWSQRVITPRAANMLTYVAELICPISGTWDEQLVKDIFCAEDAQRILRIPLRDGVDDFIAWHYDSKGNHSVKSAYKLQVQLTKQDSNGSAGTSASAGGQLERTVDQSWKRIWKLPCPAKLQMFVWRLRHEALALCQNLERRGVRLEETYCYYCGQGKEDGGHLFIRCKWAKEIWRGLGLDGERMRLEKITSVHEMLDQVWKLDENQRVLIFVFWWQWWNQRNNVCEGKLPLPAPEIIRRIRSTTLEYEQIFAPGKRNITLAKWEPPEDDTLKFNMDGAFVAGQSMIGWGVVARGADGHVVVAHAGRHDQVTDAFGAEVNALNVAISTATEMGATRVAFETDSQLLVDAMNMRIADSSPYAAIIEDLKFQIKMWFAKCRVTHYRRSANSVAHELAQIGRMCLPSVCMEWDSIVPPAVAACVSGDMPERR